jgi:hypothetical protein
MEQGKVENAITMYKIALKKAKADMDQVIEAHLNFEIGMHMYSKKTENERARSHLVEYQILA